MGEYIVIEKTIGDIVDETAKKYPNNDALVYVGRGLRLSYKEFKDRVDKLAKSLMALGIEHGDHIAVWAYNVPEWVLLQFASAKIGAVLVTVNTYYKAKELEYLLKQSDSTTLFLVEEFKDVNYVEMVKKIVPDLEETQPGHLDLEHLHFLKNIVFVKRQGSLDPSDTINMQYTSGTTGFPKGVELSHYNIVNNAYYVGEVMGMTENDRLCIPVPFFHCFGCVMSTLNSVIHGSAMVPVEQFDAGEVLKSIEQEKCTALQGVPTMFIAELRHSDFDSFELSSLRTGIMAGSSCPIEVMKEAMDKMYLKEITIAYGLTEASPVITMTRRDDPIEKRVETVGKVLPHIDAKIIDPETGEELPAGKPGELIARGYNIMKGYYKMPDKTAETVVDGWL
jgi:fatty-acyl-CoA synthase